MSKKIFHILNNVTKDKRLKHYEVRIFYCLVSYNSFKKIFPALPTISNDVGIKSISDISKGLKKLRDLGYINIQRRKHQSNIYELVNEPEIKEKVKPEVTKTTKKSNEQITFMDKAVIEIVSGEVARAKGRTETDSSDFAFVNSMLKLKKDDSYSNDSFNTVRKCLMLLYLINVHNDKFANGNNAYPYFKTVYSNSSYTNIKDTIFSDTVNSKPNSEYAILN